METRENRRSDRADAREDRSAFAAGKTETADAGAQRATASADDAAEPTPGVLRDAAGTARAAEQHVLAANRNGATANLPAAGGELQAATQDLRSLTAGREAALTGRSGASKPGAGTDGTAMTATVTDRGAAVSSQPTASLAASATVNAQLGRSHKPASQGLNDGALSAEDGASLRIDLQATQGRARPTMASALKAAGENAAAAEPSRPANPGPQAAVTMSAQAAPALPAATVNAAATAGTAAQSAQPVSGQLADPVLTSGEPAAQNQAPARSRSTGFANHMRAPTQQTPTAEQVAIQIQRAIGSDTDRITIQLRPQELGRVEVKMEVGHDGKLLAVISADKPETLDLLQRDQRSLQTALSDAGLDVDSNSLSFNLNGREDDPALAGDAGDGTQAGDSDDDHSETEALAASGHVDVITEDKVDVVL